jgi:hypothetical protein
MCFSLSITAELAYPQQQQKKDLLYSVDIQNAGLSLGRPIYTERFEVPGGQGMDNKDNAAAGSNTYTFKGNGAIKGMEIAASGSGSTNSRDDGTSTFTGRALFVSKNGSASYSFEDIATAIGNSTQRLGAAFFDANATGNLEFLKSTVGIYQSIIDDTGNRGIFAMWQLKGILK